MRTAISKLLLQEPRSLPDALRMLRDDPSLTPLAGCTDVYVNLNFGTARETRYLNLWGLKTLRGIRMKGQVLSIGSLATFSDLIGSPLVRRRIPILAMAAREVGGVQIQNRGTIGGNVVNASPAGDTPPVLAAAEATLVLQSAGGKRRIPFGAFYLGYRRTVLEPNELLVAIEIPPVSARQWFRKVGTRAAQAISKVVMAGIREDRPRIAIGSVAPTVVRVPRTEEALSRGSLEEARRAVLDEIQPIDDLRSTAAYRQRVVQSLIEQFWCETA